MKLPINKRTARRLRKITQRVHDFERLETRTVLSGFGFHSFGDSFHQPPRHDRGDSDRGSHNTVADFGRFQPERRDPFQFDGRRDRDSQRGPDQFPPPPPREPARLPNRVESSPDPVRSRPAASVPPANNSTSMLPTPPASSNSHRPSTSSVSGPATQPGRSSASGLSPAAENLLTARPGNSRSPVFPDLTDSDLLANSSPSKSKTAVSEVTSSLVLSTTSSIKDTQLSTSANQFLDSVNLITARDAMLTAVTESVLSQRNLRLEANEDGEPVSDWKSSAIWKLLVAHTSKNDERLAKAERSSNASLGNGESAAEDEGGMVELDSAFANAERRTKDSSESESDRRTALDKDVAAARQQFERLTGRRMERMEASDVVNSDHPTDVAIADQYAGTNNELVQQESLWQESAEQGGMIALIADDPSMQARIPISPAHFAAEETIEVGQIEIDRGIGLHQAFQLAELDRAIAELDHESIVSEEFDSSDEIAVLFELVDDVEEVATPKEPAIDSDSMSAAVISPLVAVAGASIWLQHRRSMRKRIEKILPFQKRS